MDISYIKRILEETYLAGFNVRGTQRDFTVTLDGSAQDKFKLHGEVKDNIRLIIEVEPEKFGGNFLRLLNCSDKAKRQGFVSLMKSVDTGDMSLLINKNAVSPDYFIGDQTVWESFKLRYTKIPFESDELLQKTAVTMCGMMLSLIDYSVEGFEEGSRTEIHANKYERNPVNRKICLASKGYRCAVCGFDFEEKYGAIGKETIEVHHTTPVSQMEAGHIVNPLEELVPVCSNCHTIIHKRKPPFSVEEVKEMLQNDKESSVDLVDAKGDAQES